MQNKEMSTDDAVMLFQAMLLRELSIDPTRQPALSSGTPEQAEARRWRCAEVLLQSLCGGPARFRDPRCRRAQRCRHLQNAASLAQDPHVIQRRPPGAIALRRAIWMWMIMHVPGAVPGRDDP
jgi:hypothetical protein